MRRFRTTGALFALLATLPWSLTVDPCGGTPVPGGETGASHAEHSRPRSHTGADHSPGHHSESHGADHEPYTNPTGSMAQACGALMACGVGLRGVAIAVAHPVVLPRPEIAWRVGQSEPSSADLTQDPPPPRRNA